MKKTLLTIFFLSVLTSCADKKNVWTTKYQQQASTELNHSLQTIVKDSVKRREMVSHVIAQLKKELPDGLESISELSLRILTNKIERDFALSKGRPQTALPWTEVTEENLRIQLAEQYAQQIPNQNTRAAFCDCLIAKLKAEHPDSLYTPIADTTLTTLTKVCR